MRDIRNVTITVSTAARVTITVNPLDAPTGDDAHVNPLDAPTGDDARSVPCPPLPLDPLCHAIWAALWARNDGRVCRDALSAREADGGRLRVLGGPLDLDGVRMAALSSRAEVVALDYVTAVGGFASELEAARGVARLGRELTQRWGMTLVLLSQMSVQSLRDQAQGGIGSHAMGGGTLGQFVDFELELYRDAPVAAPSLGMMDGAPDQGSRLIATLHKNRSGASGLSFELHPEFPALTFADRADPVERAVRRRALFRPTGVLG